MGFLCSPEPCLRKFLLGACGSPLLVAPDTEHPTQL